MARTRSEGMTISEALGKYDPSQAAARYVENQEARKTQYTYEKTIGKRLPSGVLRLKKLSPKHRQIVALHVQGRAIKKIAEEVGLAYISVWRVINDPLAKQLIDEFYESFDADFKVLKPLAIEAVREGLEDGDTKTKLSAVDRYAKLAGIGKEGPAGGPAVSVTIINGARAKLVSAIRDIAPKVIEGEAVVVEGANNG